MSGFYPYDEGTSFVRDPKDYAHDAFGHVGADDLKVRPDDVCFRKIPHTGTDTSSREPRFTPSGADNRPAQMRTPVPSPVDGVIVETGVDPEAGFYHLIEQDGTGLVWGLGHHSAFLQREGRVARGDLVARMGMSGGAKGVHLHTFVATSLEAARRQIHGYVELRNGRSVEAWAASMGLVDPYPLIVAEWAAGEERELMSAKDDIIAAFTTKIDALEKKIETRDKLMQADLTSINARVGGSSKSPDTLMGHARDEAKRDAAEAAERAAQQ